MLHPQIFQRSQRLPRCPPQLRVVALGLQFAQHHERKNHIVFLEPVKRCRIAQQHRGVEDVRASLSHSVAPAGRGSVEYVPQVIIGGRSNQPVTSGCRTDEDRATRRWTPPPVQPFVRRTSSGAQLQVTWASSRLETVEPMQPVIHTQTMLEADRSAPRSSSPAMQTSTSRMVFVGGLHRSGTSALTLVLASHPAMTTLVGTGVTENEGHYLHDVFPSAIDLGGPGKFAFDPQSHLTESDLRTGRSHDERQRIDDAWLPYWGDLGAPLRVEKSPQNLLQARYLQALYPDASFVFILRHPATVALATRKWTRPGPPGFRRVLPRARPMTLIRHWIWAHHLLDQDLPRLRHATVVRYEDLVTHPQQVLAELADFLGVPACFESSLVPNASRSYDGDWQQMLTRHRPASASRAELQWAAAAIGRWGYGWTDTLL